jgi:DNA-binding transcriptional LysR family regulator
MDDAKLSELAAFAAVARLRSFRAAAALRGVSRSTLSDAVRRLEAHLGVRLLNRTTRSVTPTEPGAQLLERLTPAMRDISEALDAVNDFRQSPMGTLRLNVPWAAAGLILPPIVAGFLKAYPGVTLEVTSEENTIDVLAAGFDAGIRYDERVERDMIAVQIGPRSQRFATAASPHYLSKHGRPKNPRDLLDHVCIRHRFPSGAMLPWEFERNGKTIRITPSGPLITNQIELELGAAIGGLGVIYGFEAWLAPAFKSATLEPLLKHWWQDFSGPVLYYPSRRHMPAPLRAFVDYVKKPKTGSVENIDSSDNIS